MIIKFFSDLHLEFMDRHNIAYFLDQLIGDDNPDVIVIPGDLSTHVDVIDWLDYIDRGVKVPVIYVPGNHEYYGNQKGVFDAKLKAANRDFENVQVLIQHTFQHMGVTFAGATGWWDSHMGAEHTRCLNDFNRIYDIKENGNGTVWGVRDRRFFQGVLENNEHVVCVSHNAPSWKSIMPEFMNSDINECFANHWDKLITKHKPIAWFHGHMHNTIEYQIGETQIACNPFGYEGHEVNPTFADNGYFQIT